MLYDNVCKENKILKIYLLTDLYTLSCWRRAYTLHIYEYITYFVIERHGFALSMLLPHNKPYNFLNAHFIFAQRSSFYFFHIYTTDEKKKQLKWPPHKKNVHITLMVAQHQLPQICLNIKCAFI